MVIKVKERSTLLGNFLTKPIWKITFRRFTHSDINRICILPRLSLFFLNFLPLLSSLFLRHFISPTSLPPWFPCILTLPPSRLSTFITIILLSFYKLRFATNNSLTINSCGIKSVGVWQKPTKFCRAIIIQLRNKFKNFLELAETSGQPVKNYLFIYFLLLLSIPSMTFQRSLFLVSLLTLSI